MRFPKLGFANIDGYDISPAMLDITQGSGVYNRLKVVNRTEGIVENSDGVYDAVVLCRDVDEVPCWESGDFRSILLNLGRGKWWEAGRL